MLNFILRLFGRAETRLDDVLAGFNRTLTQLDALIHDNDCRCCDIQEEINNLHDQRNNAANERDRAMAVRRNINELVKGA